MAAVPAEVRFLRFFDQPEEGCWLWRGNRGGTKGNKYGYFHPGSRQEDPKVIAHRFAYELWVGEIPDGFEVHHNCHRTLCVRPDHLEAVTPAENAARERQTTCHRGHDLTDPANVRWDEKGRRRGCYACRKEALKTKYATNASFREKVKARARQRYAMQKG